MSGKGSYERLRLELEVKRLEEEKGARLSTIRRMLQTQDITDEALLVLAESPNDKLKQVIHQASLFMRRSCRTTLKTEDINKALKWAETFGCNKEQECCGEGNFSKEVDYDEKGYVDKKQNYDEGGNCNKDQSSYEKENPNKEMDGDGERNTIKKQN